MNKKRVFLIVMDSFGIGHALDAEEFGDAGANTLKAIMHTQQFSYPNLAKLGLFHIDKNEESGTACKPVASYARLQETSKGKDTIIGHWEIAGVISHKAMPTFEHGFPEDFIRLFEQKTGKKTICNLPYSGTKVLEDYGEEHLRTGDLIVYTSADSVFQIAAHEDVVSVEELYRYCQIARNLLVGDLAVGRVIARPFTGTSKNKFVRTSNRHDLALSPPDSTILDTIKSAEKQVIAIGKIYDIFNGQGVTLSLKSENNADGMRLLKEVHHSSFEGLCFANLVDFDMLFGHRRDVQGYAKAVKEFDDFLEQFLPLLNEDELLMITADHGCDPSYTKTTDHTREDVPLLIYDPKNICGKNLGTVKGFDTISKVLRDAFI